MKMTKISSHRDITSCTFESKMIRGDARDQAVQQSPTNVEYTQDYNLTPSLSAHVAWTAVDGISVVMHGGAMYKGWLGW